MRYCWRTSLSKRCWRGKPLCSTRWRPAASRIKREKRASEVSNVNMGAALARVKKPDIAQKISTKRLGWRTLRRPAKIKAISAGNPKRKMSAPRCSPNISAGLAGSAGLSIPTARPASTQRTRKTLATILMVRGWGGPIGSMAGMAAAPPTVLKGRWHPVQYPKGFEFSWPQFEQIMGQFYNTVVRSKATQSVSSVFIRGKVSPRSAPICVNLRQIPKTKNRKELLLFPAKIQTAELQFFTGRCHPHRAAQRPLRGELRRPEPSEWSRTSPEAHRRYGFRCLLARWWRAPDQ